MRYRVVGSICMAVGVTLTALETSAAASPSASGAGTNYAAYLDGPLHDSYASGATDITLANAAGTHSVWSWAPIAKPGTSSYLFASPTVSSGTVYLGAETGDFYAINAATGAMKWRKKLSIDNCAGAGIVSSATVAKDPVSGKTTVYVAGADHYLYALNPGTGATVWRTLIGGTDSHYYNFSSPTIANGRIYMGVATACESAGADGVVALNQHTGAQTGVYYTAGSADGQAASVYTSAAVSDDGSVFVTTGDDNGASQNDAVSLVKLAGDTLARLDGYQIPGLSGLNSDFNASPTIFSAGSTPMVGACNKNGIFYAFRQADLSSPVWTRRLGIPPAKGSLAFCGGSAVFDGSTLYEGADARSANSAPGTMYALAPGTGAVKWSTPLPVGAVVGSPSLDGAGVLAVPTFDKPGNAGAVYLIDKATGDILRTIPYGKGPIFAQPVYAAGELLVAGPTLQAYRPAS